MIFQGLPMIKRRIVLALPLLSVLIAAPSGAQIIEQVLVNVNGEILTKTDLISALAAK